MAKNKKKPKRPDEGADGLQAAQKQQAQSPAQPGPTATIANNGAASSSTSRHKSLTASPAPAQPPSSPALIICRNKSVSPKLPLAHSITMAQLQVHFMSLAMVAACWWRCIRPRKQIHCVQLLTEHPRHTIGIGAISLHSMAHGFNYLPKSSKHSLTSTIILRSPVPLIPPYSMICSRSADWSTTPPIFLSALPVG